MNIQLVKEIDLIYHTNISYFLIEGRKVNRMSEAITVLGLLGYTEFKTWANPGLTQLSVPVSDREIILTFIPEMKIHVL